MNKNIVYLTGFMGAGKSTIGPILANSLGWNFFDLDKVIEKKLEKKIKDVFEEKGEVYFRKIETETLVELSEMKNTILSLGGGTMISEKNLEILKDSGKIIYLKASLDSIFKRLEHKRDRPNLIVDGEPEELKEKLFNRIKELFIKREKFYNKSDFIVETDGISIGITVDEIVKIINHNQNFRKK